MHHVECHGDGCHPECLKQESVEDASLRAELSKLTCAIEFNERFGDGALSQWKRITDVLERMPKGVRARWLRALCILYDVAPL